MRKTLQPETCLINSCASQHYMNHLLKVQEVKNLPDLVPCHERITEHYRSKSLISHAQKVWLYGTCSELKTSLQLHKQLVRIF